MYSIKKSLLSVFVLLFCLNSYTVWSSIVEIDLKDKIMLQLIIKNTNINELNPSLEIKLVIHNITNQTLKYKHKNVQTMVRILLLNEEGLQLNFDEVKPKEKNRNNLPLETLTLKAGTSKSFYLNYPLRDYTTDLQNIVPLFIQAQIILSKYNENQIKYGIVRSNRVELTKLD